MPFIQYLFNHITIKDIFDILIVSICFYMFFSLLKNTRAIQILQGFGVLLVILLICYLFKLKASYWLLRYSLITLAVAIPIVFQPELRRALGVIGQGKLLFYSSNIMNKETAFQVADEISWTATFLKEAKIGALIVIERKTGLKEFIETGVQVGARISSKLLLSIFMPKSPLHDGAVILRNSTVIAASCYLPLSENIPPTSKLNLGTRHLAGIGITEQTDAIVLIISEETGNISVAQNGKLSQDLSQEQLKKILISIYSQEQNKNYIPVGDDSK